MAITKTRRKIISESTSIKPYWMYDYYSLESLNQSKPRVSCSPKIDLIDLRFLWSYSKYLMMRPSIISILIFDDYVIDAICRVCLVWLFCCVMARREKSQKSRQTLPFFFPSGKCHLVRPHTFQIKRKNPKTIARMCSWTTKTCRRVLCSSDIQLILTYWLFIRLISLNE
jgi:hypothetical protein